MLPEEYSARSVQDEIDTLQNAIDSLLRRLTMIPLASAPLNPKEGYMALSDGTGSGFDATSGAGLYRYSGSAWVFIG